jgi:calcineurin-like phosphoesterase family protein
MTTWFTADSHFGHHHGIEQNRRPFPFVAEMNQAMIERWNAVVQPEDDVWHLGDFAYKSARPVASIFEVLNGKKHLVVGNHDGRHTRALAWESVDTMKEIAVDGQRIFLCHYPMLSWPAMNRGSIHLHGHVHGNTRGPAGSIDVGVDCWDFRPVSLPQILERLDERLREPAYEHQFGAEAKLTPAHRAQMRRYAQRLVQLETEEKWMTHDLIRTALDTIAHVDAKTRRDLEFICEYGVDWERELAFQKIGDAVKSVLEDIIEQRIMQPGKNPDAN